MCLVHRLDEGLAPDERPLALGPVVDREFAVEDISEDGHRMGVPSGLFPRLERDLTAVSRAGAPDGYRIGWPVTVVPVDNTVRVPE